MTRTIWIFIDGRGGAVVPVLAREALRDAAARLGLAVHAEVADPAAPRPPAGQPNPGDALVLVGGAEAPLPWAGLPRRDIGLEEALADPAALLSAASAAGNGSDTSQNTGSRRSLLSAVAGWLKK